MLPSSYVRPLVVVGFLSVVLAGPTRAAPLNAPVNSRFDASAVVLVSEKGKCLYRCRIVREECSDDNTGASRDDDVCWDGYRNCREGCGDFSPVGDGATQDSQPAPSGVADIVTLSPSVANMGKWLEGIAFDGSWLWAAESGQRRVARLDPATGNVLERVDVGRLPTDIATFDTGSVYALAATDKIIWGRYGGQQGKVLTRLSGCPDAMVAGAGSLWVLTQPDCSSDNSRLIQVDPMTGQQWQSGLLGEWAQALTVQGKQIWVAHARGPALSIVERGSLASGAIPVNGASFWSITSNSNFVYAGGRQGEDNQAGLVVMFDPATLSEIGRIALSERVAHMTSDDEHVVAVGANGTIWILSAAGLDLNRTISLSMGSFEPSSVILRDGALVVAAGKFRGENGAIFTLGDWRPSTGGRPSLRPPTQRRFPTSNPSFDCGTARIATELAICASSELANLDAELNGEYNMAVENITSEAAGGTVADVAKFRRDQGDWLVARNQCGSNAQCVKSRYEARLAFLRELNQPE